MTRAPFALALLFGGCTNQSLLVEPVFDGPAPDDPDAIATNLDTLTMSVAHAGNEQDIAAVSFAPGDDVELSNVPFGEDLVVHLVGRIGGGDVAYGRTCTFAIQPNKPTPTPHLYFARNVKFGTLGFTSFPRVGGCAVTYHDGSGLILGGVTDTGIPNPNVERFDARTGEFHAITTLAAREGAVVAELGLGTTAQVAVIGGLSGNMPVAFVEVIDNADSVSPRVDRVDDTQLAMARVDLTATSLTDGRVVVIGGREPGMPPSGTIALVAITSGAIEIKKARVSLAHPRAGHTATRLGDDVGAPVLVAGGVDSTSTAIAEVELFRPLSGDLAPPSFAFSMKHPRQNHVARLMPDRSVLILGGVNAFGQPVREIERFSIDAGFVDVGTLPATAGVVDFTATTLPDGRILIAGGKSALGNTNVDTAFIARLDVIDGSVTIDATDHLQFARSGHQATLLCDGTVLITGGTGSASLAERYNPPPLGRR